jgi:hypothetical protein
LGSIFLSYFGVARGWMGWMGGVLGVLRSLVGSWVLWAFYSGFFSRPWLYFSEIDEDDEICEMLPMCRFFLCGHFSFFAWKVRRWCLPALCWCYFISTSPFLLGAHVVTL